MDAATSTPALLLRAGQRTCALDLSHVVEIMRPLPVNAVANTPDFVTGLAIIRGEPTPVVSLALLFADPPALPTRFVLVKAGERLAALAVDNVPGIFHLSPEVLHDLPPLIQPAAAAGLRALGALDAELLYVLNAAKIVPDEIWPELAPAEYDQTI